MSVFSDPETNKHWFDEETFLALMWSPGDRVLREIRGGILLAKACMSVSDVLGLIDGPDKMPEMKPTSCVECPVLNLLPVARANVIL